MNVKLNLFLIYLLFFACNLNAQAPEINWSKTIGTPLPENLNKSIQLSNGDFVFMWGYDSEAFNVKFTKVDSNKNIIWEIMPSENPYFSYVDLQKTMDGGLIVLGNAMVNQTFKYWIIKLDLNGNIEWEKFIGNDSNTNDFFSNKLFQTSDGNYIITGTNQRSDASDYASIVKLNQNGQLLWKRDYDFYLYGYKMKDSYLTDSQGVVFCGDANIDGQHDYSLAEIDSDGNLLWQNTYGGGLNDIPYKIIETTDGGVIAAGTTAGDVPGHHGQSDIWAIKVDDTGELIWQKSLGGSSSDFLYDYNFQLIPTDDGGCMFNTSTFSTDGDISQNFGGYDNWLVKLNGNDGEIDWEKNLGTPAFDGFRSRLSSFEDGYLFMTTVNSDGGNVEGFKGGTDIWVVKLDSSGNIIWNNCYGGSLNEVFTFSTIYNNDETILISGLSRSTDGDLEENFGSSDAWTFRLGDFTAGLNEQISSSILIYPNPVKDNLYFSEKVENITIVDTLGNKIFEKINEEIDNLNISFLKNGIYFAKGITKSGMPFSFKFIKN